MICPAGVAALLFGATGRKAIARHSRRLLDRTRIADSAEVSSLLSDALATGNKQSILQAINALARGRGMSALARETGINRTVLYAALKDGANPTLETLLAITEGLGMKLRAEAMSRPSSET